MIRRDFMTGPVQVERAPRMRAQRTIARAGYRATCSRSTPGRVARGHAVTLQFRLAPGLGIASTVAFWGRSASAKQRRCRSRSLHRFAHGSHNSKFQNLTTPAPIIAPPRTCATNSPFGASFSIATRPARAPIHRRFITPPTNSRAISAQQQPRQ